MTRTILMAAAMLATVTPAPARQPDPTAPLPTEVFVAGEGGYHTYRIPSAILTPKGTLLAFAEGRRAVPVTRATSISCSGAVTTAAAHHVRPLHPRVADERPRSVGAEPLSACVITGAGGFTAIELSYAPTTATVEIVTRNSPARQRSATEFTNRAPVATTRSSHPAVNSSAQ